MTQRPFVSTEYNGIPAAVRAQQLALAASKPNAAASGRFSSRLDVPRIAAIQRQDTAVANGPLTHPAAESDSSSIESQKESGYHSGSSFGFASDTTAVDAAAAVTDGPEQSFVRGETYTEKYLADESRGDLVRALRHIDKAIECYKNALTATSLSSDGQVRLRLKYNTAVLRSRQLHKRLSTTLPTPAQTKSADEPPKLSHTVDRRPYRQSAGQAVEDRIGKYDARVDRRNTVVSEMRSGDGNGRVVQSDVRKSADSGGRYECDRATSGELKPRSTIDRDTVAEYRQRSANIRDRDAYHEDNYRNPGGRPFGGETPRQGPNYQYCSMSLGRRENRGCTSGTPNTDTAYPACDTGYQAAAVCQQECTASHGRRQRNVANIIGVRPQSAERRLENNCAISRTEYDNRRFDSLGRRRERQELQCTPREEAEHENRMVGTRANCVPVDNTGVLYRAVNASPCRAGRPDNDRRMTALQTGQQHVDLDVVSPHRESCVTNGPSATYPGGRCISVTPSHSLPIRDDERGRSVNLDSRALYNEAAGQNLQSTPRKATAPQNIQHARYLSDVSAVEATYRQTTTSETPTGGYHLRSQQRAADGRPPRPTASRDKPPPGPPRASRPDDASAPVTASPRSDDIPSGPYRQLVSATPDRGSTKGVEMYATLPRHDVTPRRSRQNADGPRDAAAAAAAAGGDYSCRSLPRTPEKRLPLTTVSTSTPRGPRCLDYYVENQDTGRANGRPPHGYDRDAKMTEYRRNLTKNSFGAAATTTTTTTTNEQWGDDVVQISWC